VTETDLRGGATQPFQHVTAGRGEMLFLFEVGPIRSDFMLEYERLT